MAYVGDGDSMGDGGGDGGDGINSDFHIDVNIVVSGFIERDTRANRFNLDVFDILSPDRRKQIAK